MTADLVEFLRARLDEDEQGARAATWDDGLSANWQAASTPLSARIPLLRWYIQDAFDDGVVGNVDPDGNDDEGVARHIARHDPAHVLADVDAKRRLVEDMASVVGGNWCDAGEPVLAEYVLCLLALPYASHPDYRTGWVPAG